MVGVMLPGEPLGLGAGRRARVIPAHTRHVAGFGPEAHRMQFRIQAARIVQACV